MDILETRIKEVCKLTKPGSKILNLGCCGDFSMHKELALKTKKLFGIDINQGAVSRLNKISGNVKVANIENFSLDKKFDYIVAGEIIEHLSNPGKMLECAAKHVKKGGQLIITTPNIDSLFIFTMVGIFNKSQDKTHVSYFDEKSLRSLVGRFSTFTIKKVTYVPPTIKFMGKNILFKILFYISTVFANVLFLISKRLAGSYILMIIGKK